MKGKLLTAYLVVASIPAMHGCYTYVPVDTSTSPPVGEQVAFEITDQGRSALAERLGPGVMRVEGSLTRIDTDQYVMRVWGLDQFRVGKVRWSGESVAIDRGFIAGVERRQLSLTKTWLAAGVVGGIMYFAFTQDLIGGGRETGDNDPDEPPASSIIWTWK
jgi:hypothetical protein